MVRHHSKRIVAMRILWRPAGRRCIYRLLACALPVSGKVPIIQQKYYCKFITSFYAEIGGCA